MNEMKRLRLVHDYTQEHLADVLNTNQPWYSKVERGLAPVPLR